ncbi:hypothetical protein N1028_13000 [Herbiconiux sp. CPCC 203407]|uniref:Uncharacterized protein n=1 Tax=Herbiconiux oxytropis TaxID=2970915 RepID=A0AA41XIW2_9MICO|nr:hypothetical protein [Herbiconiux oxytropis]MCS5723970.1 hypothetical protein [Herbiconiux oxytropis]MCS5726813.1 hypothetical protein [Herbiconiux oxytropis]
MFTSSSRALDSALLRFVPPESVSSVDAQAYGRGLAAGTYRREWSWLALLDGAVVARGVWWGPVGSVHPVELRCLAVDATVPHPEVWGAALIRCAHREFAEAGAILAPDLVVEVDSTRRTEPDVVAALAWRQEAARQAGLPVVTETVVESAASPLARVTFSARPLVAPAAAAQPALR